MKVKIWLDKSSVPLIYGNADSTYQKGDMFCIGFKRNGKQEVDKYPIRDRQIFRVNESEFVTSQPPKEEK